MKWAASSPPEGLKAAAQKPPQKTQKPVDQPPPASWPPPPSEQFEDEAPGEKPRADELKLAKMLIDNAASKELDLAKYQDTYTDKTGQTTVIQTDREQCESACNADYSRCMDTEPAQNNPVLGAPPGMFGASGECRSDLQKCLPPCKAQ